MQAFASQEVEVDFNSRRHRDWFAGSRARPESPARLGRIAESSQEKAPPPESEAGLEPKEEATHQSRKLMLEQSTSITNLSQRTSAFDSYAREAGRRLVSKIRIFGVAGLRKSGAAIQWFK
jgi:hypothetical protein